MDDDKHAVIYVSSNGEDSESCLTDGAINHCKTLGYAVENSRGTKVNIYLHQSAITCERKHIQILIDKKEYNQALYFTGIDAIPLHFNCSLSIIANVQYSKDISVTIYNFIFYEATITLCNSHVIFENCTFLNSLLIDCSDDRRHKTLVQGLVLKNVSAASTSGRFIELTNSHYVELEIYDSNLYTSLVKIVSNVLLVTINNSTLTHSGEGLQLKTFIFSPMLIRIMLSDIILSYIETNKPPLSKGAITVEAASLNMCLTNVISSQSNVRTLYAKNLDVGSFRSKFHIFLENCSFTGNHQVGSGGSIFLDFQFSAGLEMTVVDIIRSQFVNNIAERTIQGSAEGGAIYVSVAATPDDVIGIQGSRYLSINVMDCLFENNLASDSGGSLFLSEYTYSRIIKTRFLMSNASEMSYKGVFVQSKSKTEMTDVVMSVDKGSGVFEAQSSLVHLQMYLLSSEVGDLGIILQCPLWHYVNIRDDFQTSNEGNQSALQTFFLFCSKCPNTMYMPFIGQYNITQTKGDIEIVALSESGGSPAPSCQSCPYGAVCSAGNVQARPNYWGYSFEGALHFAQCPAGYCCSGRDSDKCHSYASCYGFRAGQLCGTCQEGHSVSILSGDCVRDNKCTASWFWALAILATFGYMLWYTLKDTLFQLLADIPKLIFRRKKSNVTIVREVGIEQSVGENSGNHSFLEPIGSVDKGYFGIVTYFVQIAGIMKISIYFEDSDGGQTELDKLQSYITVYIFL